jgi:hypothetical protein
MCPLEMIFIFSVHYFFISTGMHVFLVSGQYKKNPLPHLASINGFMGDMYHKKNMWPT